VKNAAEKAKILAKSAMVGDVLGKKTSEILAIKTPQITKS
jgi:hypothetical protein